MDLFHFGLKNKIIGTHKMNASSSRSHSIFTFTLEQVDPANPDNVILSKLQLVDLAGSEKHSLTAVSGKTQKESIEINKSLFTLRQVISALNEIASGKKESSGVYIPYRDSKLTCLLRQSLGGNSFCCMIACLHPSDKYLDENISTLTYASKAAQIAN
jgi:kinesin family protein 4/21/27